MQCIQKQKQTCDTGFKFASLFLHAWLVRLWLLPACGFAYKKSKLVEKWEGEKEEELIGAILVLFFSAGKKSTVFLFLCCLKKKRQIFFPPIVAVCENRCLAHKTNNLLLLICIREERKRRLFKKASPVINSPIHCRCYTFLLLTFFFSHHMIFPAGKRKKNLAI